jgi:hypothetical protein
MPAMLWASWDAKARKASPSSNINFTTSRTRVPPFTAIRFALRSFQIRPL